MSEFLHHAFAGHGFMPHGHCYLWNPWLVWLHVLSDGLVAAAYTSIPFTLVYFVRKRRDLPFNWMFLCFGAFIISCGATHMMEIWTLWVPSYWLAGAVKAITAVASVLSAILLVRLVPRALALPTHQQLAKAHAELRLAHEALESRVLERTQELTRKNEELAQEIADRMRVEAALRKSEGRFQRLANAGILGIIHTDLDGAVYDANPTFLAMVGYTAEDVGSGAMRWSDMTPPEWREVDERALAQLRTTGVAAPWEKEYVRKNGTRLPVFLGAAMLDAAAGECVAFVLDFTALKNAQAAVRDSQAHKTAVLEAALDAIVMMDQHGTLTEFNPSAERIFGYERHEVIGKKLADMLIPARLRDRHAAGLRDYLARGEHHVLGRRVEMPAMRSSGEEFPAEVAVVRIHSEGNPVFTGYIRDITERRQAAEAEGLRRAKEAAEEANAELESFSYSVAHDLRAPLRAISGFSTALLEDCGDRIEAEGKSHLERITSAAERMSELIDALLALARLTRTEIRRDPVDLAELARRVVLQLRESGHSRRVDVVIPERLAVRGDESLLLVLLENLLGNAWKFNSKKEDARIELGMRADDGVQIFFIRDNGAGFDGQHVGKLFTPFRRLHTSQQFEGTGIGLATVQRIVRRHGGRIWAEGRENEGAVFHFTLSSAMLDSGAEPWKSKL